MLTDDTFRRKVADYIVDELGVSHEWFRNQRVLDAGCGIGRWTFGFVKLGSEVVAFDASRPACHALRQLVREQSLEVLVADASRPPLRRELFDLVFCWGVLHHLPQPAKTFHELAKLVRPGGFMHVYVYGRKGLRIRFWRTILQSLPLRPRHLALALLTRVRAALPALRPLLPLSPSVHANFDALSPTINYEYAPLDIHTWFNSLGFAEVTHLHPTWFGAHRRSRDIHMRGLKPIRA